MPAEDCLFCKIATKQLPSEIVYEDDDVVAFKDIQPQAPVHLLVIPRRHIPSLAHVTAADAAVLGKVLCVASQLAKEQGISEDGYRTVINCGPNGLQSVYHLHVHVLGGRKFGWPPG